MPALGELVLACRGLTPQAAAHAIYRQYPTALHRQLRANKSNLPNYRLLTLRTAVPTQPLVLHRPGRSQTT